MTQTRLTVVLLAGGPATRLPGKLLLDAGGEPMVARVYRRLARGGWPFVISVRETSAASIRAALDRVRESAPASERTSYEIAVDEIADGGPLGGLRSAFRLVRTPLAFAAAADIANLTSAFVDKLVAASDAAGERRPAAVLPTWPDGKVEPLAALYDARAFAAGAEAALRAGKRKVTAALDGLDVLSFSIGAADAPLLRNINTPADYEATFGNTSAVEAELLEQS